MTQPKREKPWLTIPAAAKLIGISRQGAWQQADQYGTVYGIPVIQVTPTRRVLSRKAIERLIDGQTEQAATPLPWDVPR